jgi:HK97 family phage major capsid protein
MKKEFLTLAMFLAAKSISDEQFAAKSADEQAALYNELNTHNKEVINEMRTNSVSKAELDAAMDKFRESQIEQMTNLNKSLESLGLQIKAMGENGGQKEEKKTLKSALKSMLDGGVLGKIKEGVQSGMTAVFKAADDMLISTNVSGGNVPVEQRLSGLNRIATRPTSLLDVVNTGVATSNLISWVYQANKDGAAGQTEEGAAKNQIDFDLVVASQKVEKTTAYIKVSTEMLDDIDFIESEINNELIVELLKAVESSAFTGNGTTPALNGVYTVATTFAAGTSALTVDNANEVDVINCALKQIKLAHQTLTRPYIFMHPDDVYKLLTLKVSSSDKRYVDMVYVSGSELRISGIPIIETTLISSGNFLVGDFSKATLFNKGSYSIMMGLDGNDLTLNMRTIVAEWRGAMVVKNNDRTAFVKGVFATAKAALETT